MESRIETLLDAVINEGTIENFEPRSRVESYLLSCVNGTGAEDDLPEPVSRVDALLYTMAKEGGGAKENPLRRFLGFTDPLKNMFYHDTELTSLHDCFSSQDDVADVTDFYQFCDGATNLVSVPEFKMTNATTLYRAFAETALTEVKFDFTGNDNSVGLGNTFDACENLKEVTLTNFKGVAGAAFQNCISLEKVLGIKQLGTDAGDTNVLQGTFYGCVNIKVIEVDTITTSLTVGSGDTYGHLIEKDNLIALIRALANPRGGVVPAFTVGSVNLTKLSDVYVKYVEITEEMIANDPFITLKKPFEVCAETDEGAMLISEYVSLKRWNLK